MQISKLRWTLNLNWSDKKVKAENGQEGFLF